MKVKQLKKVLSVTLAAIMLVTSVPLGTSAGEVSVAAAPETKEPQETVAPPETAETPETTVPPETAETTDITEIPETAEITETIETTETLASEEIAGNAEAAKNGDDAGTTENVETSNSTDDTTDGANSAEIGTETVDNIGTNEGETSGETMLASSEDARNNTLSEELVGQNPQPSEGESNGLSNGMQEISANGEQEISQEEESVSESENSAVKEKSKKILSNERRQRLLEGREVTVNWGEEPYEATWDGKAHGLDPTTTDDIELKVTYTLKDGRVSSEEKPTEVGTYTVKAEIKDTSSHPDTTLTNAEVDFTIKKVQVTSEQVIWDNLDDLTYNGGKLFENVSVSFVGVDEENISATTLTIQNTDISDTVNKSSIINVGNYTITAQYDESVTKHYDIIDSTALKKSITVKPCEVTLDCQNATATYDGTAHTIEYTVIHNNLCTDDATIREKITVTYAKEDGTPVEGDGPVEVGKYTATAKINDSNHKFADGSEEKTIEFEIKPCEIALEWKDTTAVYDGKAHTIAYTATHNESCTDDATIREKITVTYAKEDGTPVEGDGPVEVGKYTATAKIKDPNHEFAGGPEETIEFEIKSCEITLEWKDTTAVYDGKAHTIEYIVTHKGSCTDDATIRDKIIVTYTKEDGAPVEGDGPVEVGKYTATARIDDSNHKFADATEETIAFEIKPCEITLKWQDTMTVYDGKAHTIEYTVAHNELCTDDAIIGEKITVTYAKEDGTPVEGAGPVEVGKYTATAKIDDSNHTFTGGSKETTCTLTITVCGGVIVSPAKKEKIYDNMPTQLGYEIIDWGDIKDKDQKSELESLLNDNPLIYAAEDVGTYTVDFTEEGKQNFYNYNIKVEGDFTITPRPITIVPDPGQGKYYGKSIDPALTYTIAEITNGVIEKTGITEAMVRSVIDATPLGRDMGDGTNKAGTYKFIFTGQPANFTVTLKDEFFTIYPLPVTIIPNEGQKKIFGQKEPTKYGYSAVIATDKMVQGTIPPDIPQTDLTDADVMAALGEFVLVREAGEGVGTHKFCIVTEESDLYKKMELGNILANYSLEVKEDAPVFTILPVEIKELQAIDSRQDSFKVTTNLKGERQPGVTTAFKVEIAEYPGLANGVNYSTNIDDYITGATTGVAFVGTSDTIKINAVEYSKERKDNKKLVKWNGYLPAGAKIAVSVVDANGNVVSDKTEKFTVSPVNVSFDWSGYETSPSTGNYVTANKGMANPLSLTGDRAGELVEIICNGKAADYSALDLQFVPSIQNGNMKHATQSVTANIVDTLNLVCESKSLQFYVDDSAFAIPSSSIRFENRGDEIIIELPEQGTLTEVSVLGGEVELSGNVGQEFTLPVDWSGKSLIPTGAPISVTYTDQAGHQGSGIASATRSSVSTPISFQIRPELNGAGYLNGRSDTLIITGTACSCEPIRLTVAGATQTTYATQKDVWSDSNGSWEAMISMSSLPEEQDFTISAEYVDVNGSPYSITAKFDSFCASAAIVSPVYEAMSYISGMVEPNTAVALVVNGDEQNYYEMHVDRFGHFVMDDVPMMFGGEDSFDIYVTDIAGNVSIRHYEVEEPGDPFEVTSRVNPLGKFLYSAAENDSVTFIATPVSAADFDKKKTNVKIPLLMGMSYEVGTLTLHKTENGFTISKEIKMDKDIAEEDYRFEDEKLYLYTSRPSIEELKRAAGQEIAYGAEIPLGEGEIVWIASEGSMTILADDIMDLKQFDFENSEEYVKYQEQ